MENIRLRPYKLRYNSIVEKATRERTKKDRSSISDAIPGCNFCKQCVQYPSVRAKSSSSVPFCFPHRRFLALSRGMSDSDIVLDAVIAASARGANVSSISASRLSCWIGYKKRKIVTVPHIHTLLCELFVCMYNIFRVSHLNDPKMDGSTRNIKPRDVRCSQQKRIVFIRMLSIQ
ncbi:hypothetical protein ALC53_00652 [Atta colombica]|uniref:Uncharacterized protein n=1 Tax=Atta colombica TaxID=520822 RepID=A0A195BWQ6_9HYME|nr:hypothetical protein ALC53_00652 [Atta colombica]